MPTPGPELADAVNALDDRPRDVAIRAAGRRVMDQIDSWILRDYVPAGPLTEETLMPRRSTTPRRRNPSTTRRRTTPTVLDSLNALAEIHRRGSEAAPEEAPNVVDPTAFDPETAGPIVVGLTPDAYTPPPPFTVEDAIHREQFDVRFDPNAFRTFDDPPIPMPSEDRVILNLTTRQATIVNILVSSFTIWDQSPAISQDLSTISDATNAVHHEEGLYEHVARASTRPRERSSAVFALSPAEAEFLRILTADAVNWSEAERHGVPFDVGHLSDRLYRATNSYYNETLRDGVYAGLRACSHNFGAPRAANAIPVTGPQAVVLDELLNHAVDWETVNREWGSSLRLGDLAMTFNSVPFSGGRSRIREIVRQAMEVSRDGYREQDIERRRRRNSAAARRARTGRASPRIAAEEAMLAAQRPAPEGDRVNFISDEIIP